MSSLTLKLRIAHDIARDIQPLSQDFVGGGYVSFLGGVRMKKRKLLGLHMMLGLRFGAGAATSGAGAGAPVASALATDLGPLGLSRSTRSRSTSSGSTASRCKISYYVQCLKLNSTQSAQIKFVQSAQITRL